MLTFTVVGFGTGFHCYHEVRASSAHEALGLVTRMYSPQALKAEVKITWQVFEGLPLLDEKNHSYCMRNTKHLPV